jgi:hypothetical protein
MSRVQARFLGSKGKHNAKKLADSNFAQALSTILIPHDQGLSGISYDQLFAVTNLWFRRIFFGCGG